MDLPLPKCDITTILSPQKPVIYCSYLKSGSFTDKLEIVQVLRCRLSLWYIAVKPTVARLLEALHIVGTLKTEKRGDWIDYPRFFISFNERGPSKFRFWSNKNQFELLDSVHPRIQNEHAGCPVQKWAIFVLIKASQGFVVRRMPVRRSRKPAENAYQGKKGHLWVDTR